jgi:hypothetical protein
VFKEAAGHNEVPESAAARLITYSHTGIAKKGYRAHLDEAPLSFPTYPYMVKYLLETYAVDDELARAYMAVTTAKQAENEGERAFDRRLHRLAIKAGNVVDKRDLTTIYVEGLLQFFQSGLRMHLTPGMSSETVQRHAHNLGVSLRQTVQQSAQPVTQKFPPGVKGLLPRGGSLQSVNSTETADLEDPIPSWMTRIWRRWKPLWQIPMQVTTILPRRVRFLLPVASLGGRPCPVSLPPVWYRYPLEGGRALDVSVRSEPPARTGISKPILCFLCYEDGHYLAECPRLPAVLQREATANREAYQRNREAARKTIPTEGMSNRHKVQHNMLNVETAMSARDTPIEPNHTSVEEDNSQEGSENLSGGN